MVGQGRWGENTLFASIQVPGNLVGDEDYFTVREPERINIFTSVVPATAYVMVNIGPPMPSPVSCNQPVWNIGCNAPVLYQVPMGSTFASRIIDHTLIPFDVSIQLLIVPDFPSPDAYAYSSAAVLLDIHD